MINILDYISKATTPCMPNSKAAKIVQQMREQRLLQDAEITDFLQKNGMIGTDDRIDIFMEMACNNPLWSYNKYMQNHIMELFSDSERFFELVLRLAEKNNDMSLS